jgi:acyl-[acyl-carrier-protein]-phospholipid O-acyltransferase/long-chain-fatty-acid--[acyl-carrier-protein] ligase
MKGILRFVLRFLFGFRAYGEESLKAPGPVLLLPNHVSWLDWVFLLACTDDDWKCVVSERAARTSWLHRKIMINRRTFPIETDSPYAVKHMAEFLEKGGRLVLFPEGRLSRTGTLMKLFDGTGFLLHKTGAKVITCYIRGAHRLPASPNPNRKQLCPQISLHFSPVLTPPHVRHMSTSHARYVLTTWLRDQMVHQQFDVELQNSEQTVARAIVATAVQYPKHEVLHDLNGGLNYKRLLIGAGLMQNQFTRKLDRASRHVGVLLPNVNATPVVLLALWAMGKTPALLNYSTGGAIMLACAQLAELKQIVTSRAFISRAKLDVAPMTSAGIELIYLEDIRAGITGLAKLGGALRQSFSPGLDCVSVSPSDTAVILFTSGSEGVPKGVELTHRNILANVQQMLAVCDLIDTDRLFNAMPMFHSFGLSVGTVLPLVRGLFTYIYPSPLHYRVVPTVFYHSNCTVMLGTNTFLTGYARKAHPYDFRSLRYLFAGAEKLQEVTARVWSERFGVHVLEGYGATECSPAISVNTPMESKQGSTGKLMPGMDWKIEPVEGVAEGGRLLVRGPNIMKGYLNPDANAKFLALDGWYDTGDIVRVDEERYIFIQGRLKRFAKVSGEMISLTAVEDALAGAFPQFGLRCQTAVVTRPDEHKGEVLIAVTNEPKLTIDDVRGAIRTRGLPNIAIPRELKCIHELPRLGTGKVNHRELQKIIENGQLT